jgi:hypothetical protein
MAITSIGAFTFVVLPVVVNNGSASSPVWEVNPTLTGASSGSPVYVWSIVDPTSTSRIFNPVAEGNPVVLGTDAYTVWLPSLQASPSYTSKTDYLNNSTVDIGQVQIQLVPASKNTVEAASVMRYYVSPQAYVVQVTAGTF